MEIKRTIKDGFKEAGQTEVIGEERMRQIIKQVAGLSYTKSGNDNPDSHISRLLSTGKLETFYATYELIGA